MKLQIQQLCRRVGIRLKFTALSNKGVSNKADNKIAPLPDQTSGSRD